MITAIGAALYLAARTSGAGWLMVLLCGLAGILLLALSWPRPALARVRVTARGPRDATAGEVVAVELGVTRAGLGVRLRPLEPMGDWTAVAGAGTTVAQVVPARRGVITELTIEASSAAPFGLVWWRRRMSVPMENPIEVAPRRGDVPVPDVFAGRSEGEATSVTRTAGDRVRTLRDYRPGDPMRLVHWPATARRGEVIVKELEQPEHPRLAVIVDLRGDADAAEHAAEHAMGVVCGALDEGLAVDLHTHEAAGPVGAPAASAREAGRRLARATAGAPSEPGADARVVRIAAARRPR